MKIGFRTKLWLGYAGLMLLVLAVGAVALSVVKSGRGAVERILHENRDSVAACTRMTEAADRLLLDRLAHAPGAAPFEAPAAPRETFEQALRFQQGNLTIEGEPELTRDLAASWARFQAELAREPEVGARAPLLAAFDDLQHAAHRIAELNLENIVSVHGEVQQAADDVESRLWVILLAALAFGSLFMVLTGDAVLKPVYALTRAVESIARGNLDVNVPVLASDEMGNLARSFNAMVGSLRQFQKLGWAGVTWVHHALGRALEQVAEPVAVLDAAGNVVLANAPAQRYLGLRAGGGGRRHAAGRLVQARP
ncbi:MAG: HAMP domain-containing protein [Planctomycetota bacterium]|nr:HAMP domain-containing protein [Planctomycetota bacterium]